MLERYIGDYLLVQELGKGSMGDTYLAEHRYLKRLFILKLLPQELSSDREFIKRFEKEVAALSKLEHPHIAKIHNASCADGIHYLVAEPILYDAPPGLVNLDGHSSSPSAMDRSLGVSGTHPASRSITAGPLEDPPNSPNLAVRRIDTINHSTNLAQYFVRKHYKLAEEEIFRIARQLASALDFAHDAILGTEPIAHGSIKLNNIVIKEGKEGVEVYLTDFGLSRILGALPTLSRTYHAMASTLAEKGGFTVQKGGEATYSPGPWNLARSSELHRSFCQNFLFLAPEQKMIGNPKANPAKSDVYAFGVLLYYLLTGEFPEGYFELPSKKAPELKWNWDLLICRTLQTDPLKRPENLCARIDELLTLPAEAPSRIQLQKLKAIKEETLVLAPSYAGATATPSQVKPVIRPKEITRPSFEADPGAIFQMETLVAPYKPAPQEDKEIEPLLAAMAVVPAGPYLRGSQQGGKDEIPRHEIHLQAFAIDVHPVTNEQFVRFLEVMGGEKDGNNNDIIRLRESRIKRSGGKLNIESGYAKHPVVGVTWYGAVAYARWVGKRLPTEAEWEVAAYGGREDYLYPTGNEIERTDANFFSSDTTPVMSYTPNGFGLYDMAGNVYEWCQDWYYYHFYDVSVQEPDNPKGPVQGVYRVLRGGCWKSSKEDLRCAHRHRNNPGLMNGTYGFRCAADVATED